MVKLCKNYYRAASLPTAPLKKSHLIFGLSSLSLNEVEPVNASNHFNKVNYKVCIQLRWKAEVFDQLGNFNITNVCIGRVVLSHQNHDKVEGTFK